MGIVKGAWTLDTDGLQTADARTVGCRVSRKIDGSGNYGTCDAMITCLCLGRCPEVVARIISLPLCFGQDIARELNHTFHQSGVMMVIPFLMNFHVLDDFLDLMITPTGVVMLTSAQRMIRTLGCS